MASAEKNKQIVLLTVFATVLVIIGHSDITDNFKSLWIYRWVYSFHMPLFFFISGFLFCLSLLIEKLKRTVRLLVPFLFINTIIWMIKVNLITDQSIMQHPVTFDFGSLIETTLFTPMGSMWFLPAWFTIFISIFYI